MRISFLPPPLEGKINLGIYDKSNQLVRVLHRDAAIDEFTIGPDALVTKWDGRNDAGMDLPAGKYQARGFMVGLVKIGSLGRSTSTLPQSKSIKLKLMANPLANDETPVVSFDVGFDGAGSFLKTTDGLPVLTIAKEAGLTGVAVAKNGEKSVDIWQDNGSGVEQYRISNLDQMMAFDCGAFELK